MGSDHQLARNTFTFMLGLILFSESIMALFTKGTTKVYNDKVNISDPLVKL